MIHCTTYVTTVEEQVEGSNPNSDSDKCATVQGSTGTCTHEADKSQGIYIPMDVHTLAYAHTSTPSNAHTAKSCKLWLGYWGLDINFPNTYPSISGNCIGGSTVGIM